jgi:hypothetical protein
MPTQIKADIVTPGSVQRLDHKLVDAKFVIVTNGIVVTTVRSKLSRGVSEGSSPSRVRTLLRRWIFALPAWSNKSVSHILSGPTRTQHKSQYNKLHKTPFYCDSCCVRVGSDKMCENIRTRHGKFQKYLAFSRAGGWSDWDSNPSQCSAILLMY